MRGVISIIVGCIMIIQGLMGHMVLIGTQSGAALAAVGAVVVAIGVFRVTRQA